MKNYNLYRAEIDIMADLSAIEVDESLKEALFDNKHLIKLLFLQRFSNFMKHSFRQVECLLPNNCDIKLNAIRGIDIAKEIEQYFPHCNGDFFNLRVIITDDKPITQSLKLLLDYDELLYSGIFNIIGYKIDGQVKEIALDDMHKNGEIIVTDFLVTYHSDTLYREPETFALTLENYNRLFFGDNVERYIQLDDDTDLPNYLVEQHLFHIINKDDIPVYFLSEAEKQNIRGNNTKENTRKDDLLMDFINREDNDIEEWGIVEEYF